MALPPPPALGETPPLMVAYCDALALNDTCDAVALAVPGNPPPLCVPTVDGECNSVGDDRARGDTDAECDTVGVALPPAEPECSRADGDTVAEGSSDTEERTELLMLGEAGTDADGEGDGTRENDATFVADPFRVDVTLTEREPLERRDAVTVFDRVESARLGEREADTETETDFVAATDADAVTDMVADGVGIAITIFAVVGHVVELRGSCCCQMTTPVAAHRSSTFIADDRIWQQSWRGVMTICATGSDPLMLARNHGFVSVLAVCW